ncbi:MAG: hypothetical protein AB8H79_01310 [Myxococcota bacterium]
MWLLIAILGTWAMAAEPSVPAADDATRPLKPAKTVGALGLTMRTNGLLLGVARLRWPNAISVDVQIGGAPTWSRLQSEFGTLGDIETRSSTRTGHVGANLRWPIVQSDRQDLLWTIGIDGTVSRSRVQALPGVQSIVPQEEIRQIGSAAVHSGVALDHWLTPRCAVTVGVHLVRGSVTRREVVGEGIEDSRNLGFSGRVLFGVVGVL